MIEETPTGGLRRVDPDPNLIEFSEDKGFIEKEDGLIRIVLKGCGSENRVQITITQSGSIEVFSVYDNQFLSVDTELTGDDAAEFIKAFQYQEDEIRYAKRSLYTLLLQKQKTESELVILMELAKDYAVRLPVADGSVKEPLE